MSDDPGLSAEGIAERAREDLRSRLRVAYEHQLSSRPPAVMISDAQLEELVGASATRAGGVLWRRCLAGAAAEALSIGVREAASHPEVERAHEIVGAPPYREADLVPALAVAPEPSPGAVRVAAVHLGGIESLRRGESDIELRFSDSGLDVLKASTGAPIGRLQWGEIETVSVSRPHRGVRAGRRRELHISTGRGRASFELPGLGDRQLHEQLEPLLAHWRPDEPRDG